MEQTAQCFDPKLCLIGVPSMSPETVLYMGSTAVSLILYLSLPIIGAITAIGLLIAMLQTLIQLQEQTVAFGSKLVMLAYVLTVMGGWMSNEMLLYLNQIFLRIAES